MVVEFHISIFLQKFSDRSFTLDSSRSDHSRSGSTLFAIVLIFI